MEFHIVRSRPIDNVAKVFLEKGNIILTVNLLRNTSIISKNANIGIFYTALKIVEGFWIFTKHLQFAVGSLARFRVNWFIKQAELESIMLNNSNKELSQ